VALVLPEEPTAHGGSTPPEGYGALPEEAVVRDVVTDVVSASTGAALSDAGGREKVKRAIRKRLRQTTDVQAEDVLIPDITVQ
jgi:flagellar basal body-associated protein FliL